MFRDTVDLILSQCLETLEIYPTTFKNYSEEDLKTQYRYLVKKYHPDKIGTTNSYVKMAKINDARDTLYELIRNGYIKLKSNTNSESKKENVSKPDNGFRELYNRLEKLNRKININKKTIFDNNQIMIIDKSIEVYNEMLEKIKILIDSTSIYDYGIILNYVELFEYFYSKTLRISVDNEFDFNHSNHKKESNDKIEVLKDKISLVHKQLLYKEINKIIKDYFEGKSIDEDAFERIEKIDIEIINIKWYMKLSNFDFNTFDERVKSLIKKFNGGKYE